MRINVSVVLEENDVFQYTPDAGAMQVLVALGGNASNDYCSLRVETNQGGQAGTPPPPVTP